MAIKVQEKTDIVKSMDCDWDLVNALLGGTRAMREKGGVYLPQRPAEEADDYKIRLNLATLYPAFSETIMKMTGRVFAEAVKVGKDVPSWIQDEVLTDVDMQKRDVQVYCRELFGNALARGHMVVLCDSPNKPDAKTQADQKAAGMRPYWVTLFPENILGWQVTPEGVLTQLRVATTTEKPDGPFGTVCVKQVKVYQLTTGLTGGLVTVTTYEEPPKNVNGGTQAVADWIVVGTVTMQSDVIPIVPFYTNRTGYLTSKPPLMELAYLNSKHWRIQSGTDSLVDTTSVPILAMFGGGEDSVILVGAKQALQLPVDADLRFIEHTGKAVETGAAALTQLKEEMRDAGAKLLVPGTGKAGNASMGNKTATQSSEEAAADNSALGSMVQDFATALADLLDMTAKWRDEDDGGTLEPQPNLDPETSPMETVKFLLDMANSGKLSDETLFEETQKRGFISEDLEFEDEQARLKSQPDHVLPPTPPVAPKPVPAPVPSPTPVVK